jgi:putative alpha-1,2-mannosidase
MPFLPGQKKPGDINLMPATREVKLARGIATDPESGMYSLFDRKTERAKAGYYAVHLDRYEIDVELTATKRVGFHRYTFPQAPGARVIIDLENGQALFDMKDGEELYVKVTLSPVCIENVKMNMKAELPGWDFERTIVDFSKGTHI